IQSSELRQGLQDLERSRLITVLSPGKYLVIRVAPWPGHDSRSTQNAHEMASSGSRGYSYSFHKHTIDESKAIAAGAEGADAGETLLREILETVGESDPATFRGVLTHYTPADIRMVLDRVRRTPPEKVRKSKTALFRYLLTKLSPSTS